MQKVTVIVPVYNVEKYLARCLDSLLNQTYENYEIYCVNDCSPDNSQAILEEYAEKYPELLHVMANQENMGQGRSRMRAVYQTDSDYIMFVDSDDYVAKDYIERFMSEVKEEPYDIVVAGFTRDIDGKCKEHDIKDSPWTLACYSVACAKMIRRQFLLEHGIDFTEIRCGEDIYFNTAIYYQDVKYKIIHYFGYYYYLNRQSTTGSLTYDKKHEVFVSQMFDIFLKKFPLEKVSEEKRRVIEYTYVANMVNALITYGHGCKPKLMKEKHQFFIEDMKEKFPDYKKNPYFNVWKPKGQSLKIRLGVGVTMMLHKLHLDGLLFWFISWI